MNNGGDKRKKKKMNYKEAWERYCNVSNWREAGQHVDWAYEIEADTIYIYLQGSDEKIDWKRDFMLKPLRWVYGLWIHKGFYAMAKELYDDNNFRNIFEQNGYLKRFVLIGHSCGGAIALLTVALAFYLYTTIEVYTFGAPCIFWLNSADSIIKESKNIRITNVRLNRDIIPKLLLPFGYRKNPGNHIVLESPYFNPIKSHLPDSYNKAIKALDKMECV